MPSYKSHCLKWSTWVSWKDPDSFNNPVRGRFWMFCVHVMHLRLLLLLSYASATKLICVLHSDSTRSFFVVSSFENCFFAGADLEFRVLYLPLNSRSALASCDCFRVILRWGGETAATALGLKVKLKATTDLRFHSIYAGFFLVL